MKKIKWKDIKIILLILACVLFVVDGAYLWITTSKTSDHIKASEHIAQVNVEKINFISGNDYFVKYPPNTVYAIDEAVENGFESVLLDVRLTKDKKWVCFKDESLLEATGQEGNVRDYTYFDLLKFSLKKKEEEMTTPVINLLDEVLKKCAENAVLPIIYVHTPQEIESLIEILKNTSMISDATVMMENYDSLVDFSQKYPNIKTLYRVSTVDSVVIDSLRMIENGTVCFDGSLEDNDAEMLLTLKENKYNFSCYNVNEPERLKLYTSIGAVNIITDKFIPQ